MFQDYGLFFIVYPKLVYSRLCDYYSKVFSQIDKCLFFSPVFWIGVAEKKASGYSLCAQQCNKYCSWLKKSTRLGFCTKEVLNQIWGKRSILTEHESLMEDRIYWQQTKRQSGHIQNCMAQAVVMLSIFWFDVPLKVLWPTLTCRAVVKCCLLSQSSLLWYTITENSKKIFCLNKPDHFYMWQPSRAGAKALCLVMLVTEW
jgi:hypothetical protein